MTNYAWEFWLGRGDRYWNWEFKGVDDDDYFSRAAHCEKIIEEVERETPDFIRVHGTGIPLKLGYSGVLKKGSFTIRRES